MRFGSLFVVALLSLSLYAQEGSVRGTVKVLHRSKSVSANADVVVWLTATSGKGQPIVAGTKTRLAQKNKQFMPHVVAVPVGTAIEFPNLDPFFHDVFSIYHGKPFDLGLYESGAVRSVRFSQPGVSYIFCNIHPEMSAAVVALTTPYFSTTGRDGVFEINHVPAGQYKLGVWYELASEAELAALSRTLEIKPGRNELTMIPVHASDANRSHTNKYGEVYSSEKDSKY